jgi:hypothetical protein
MQALDNLVLLCHPGAALAQLSLHRAQDTTKLTIDLTYPAIQLLSRHNTATG